MLVSILVGCGSNQSGGAAGSGSDQGTGAGGNGPDQGTGTGGSNPGQGGGTGAGGSIEPPAECFETKPGCILPSGATRIEDPDVSEEDLASLSRNNASFALDLGRALHNATENVLYSPFSISTALAMSYAGARTTTEQAMAAAMRFELPQERLHPAFNHVDLELKKRSKGASNTTGGGFRLHTANAIWSHIDLPIEAPFLKVLGESYGAPVRLADFNDPAGTEDLINAWVNRETDGKIPELLDGDLSRDTQLVLVNAISFDAAWREPFEEEATKPGPFRRGDNTSVTAEMMHGNQDTLYGASDGWEAVELPYAGTPVSMLIVMPAEGTADAFQESLDGAGLEAIVASMENRFVDITMPKFSFRSSAPLRQALEGLGMEVAFQPGADFSGILSGEDLQIEDVVHQAFIDVDEAGTEAAAATAVVMSTGSGGGEPAEAPLVLDHPFFFFIRDVPTGALLFAGRINDPTAH
ncbi:serpin family protein [Sorangium sp. So ce1099]|uniref:serpin family protein n=1 Tax=Sorangium sp. So ce1099 TaxID=3133331 RepID=UPI003F5EAE8B